MQRRALLAAAAALPSMSPLAQSARANDEAIAKVLQTRLRGEGMGLSAAVVEGANVRVAGAGRRSAMVDTPPDGDTLFELGSITKTFTALLLADMAIRGELKLDDAVETVLPDGLQLRDSAGASLTWNDLATHRSGLPRLPSNLRDPSGADPYDYSRKELLSFLASWKPQRARGAQWEYSNVGFGLLGEAMALRARTSYATLLTDRVLKPLGLTDMHLAVRDTAVPGLMPGHDASKRPALNWRFDAIAGAGALVGSARSLARFAQAALGSFDHPLKDAFKLALSRRGAGPNDMNPMGLAWIIAPLNGRRVFNHDGGTAGYSTSLFLDPERQRAALVLSNMAIGVNDLSLHLLDPSVPPRDLVAEKKQTERKTVSIPAEALGALAGTYAFNPQFKVTIRHRDGKLFAQATGQGEFELFAFDTRKFFARVTPLEMHFEGDRDASPAFVLHQAGQMLRFVKE